MPQESLLIGSTVHLKFFQAPPPPKTNHADDGGDDHRGTDFVFGKGGDQLYFFERYDTINYKGLCFSITLPGGLLSNSLRKVRYGEPICLREARSENFLVVAGAQGHSLDCVHDYVCAKGEEEVCIVRRSKPFEQCSENVDLSESEELIFRMGDGNDVRPFVFLGRADDGDPKLISNPSDAVSVKFTKETEFTIDQYDQQLHSRYPLFLKNHLIKSGDFSGAKQALIFDSEEQKILGCWPKLPSPLNQEEVDKLIPSVEDLTKLFNTIHKRPHEGNTVATVTLLGHECTIPEDKESVLMLLKKNYDIYSVWRASFSVGDEDFRVLATVVNDRYLIISNCQNDTPVFMRGRSLMALLVRRIHDFGRLLEF